MASTRLHFAAACLGMLLFCIVLVSLGTVNTFLASSMNLEPAALASLAAVLPLGILAGSLVFGPVVDRVGYRTPFLLSALLVGAGFEAIAFSGSVTIIQAAFFCIGVGGGVLNGGTNALVSDISGEVRGARLSFLGVFFGVGALGMPALTSLLVTVTSYGTIVAGVGVLVLVSALFFAGLRFPDPKRPQGFPLREGLRLVRDGGLLALAIVLFFESGAEGMANTWTVHYLREGVAASPEDAPLALTVFAIGLTVARLVLGGLLRRVRPDRAVFVCITLAVAVGFVLIQTESVSGAFLALVLFGVGCAPVFPVVLGYIGERYPALTGTAFSLALVIALLGNTVLNYLTGTALAGVGVQTFPVILTCTAAAVALMFWAARRITVRDSLAGSRRAGDHTTNVKEA